ncbi:MAG: 3-deoxy-manno-octulosonate cytidylyltransferase [Candidatus Kapaibacteriota bacterium]
MKALGIIPARYAATRFPGKPLVDLLGRTMIQRVWEGAMESERLSHVLIATDDERIARVCEGFGADVVMTAPELPSGTDRILAAYRQYAVDTKTTFDAVVNIQGDEPLLPGAVVDALLIALANHDLQQPIVTTPIQQIISSEELLASHIVKVALNQAFKALYFSRSPIPHYRKSTVYSDWLTAHTFWKHIGIYAYTTPALRRFGEIAPSPLEEIEQLEQLRLLENGVEFYCVPTDEEFVAVDIESDAEKVREILRQRQKNPA